MSFFWCFKRVTAGWFEICTVFIINKGMASCGMNKMDQRYKCKR